MTGLPFVFAVWAYHQDHPDPAGLTEIAHAARRAGCAALDDVARREAARLNLPEARCRDYLENTIRYELGAREQEAMERFRALIGQYAADLPTGEGAAE